MSGNAFAVPVISHILEPVAAFLLRADHPIPELLPGFPEVNSKEESILSLLPGEIDVVEPFPVPSRPPLPGNSCRRPS